MDRHTHFHFKKIGRLISSLLVGTILASIAFNATKNAGASANEDDEVDFWYIGKGLIEGMYLQYILQHDEFNDGKPVLFLIYFERFVNDTQRNATSIGEGDGNISGQSYWTVPFEIVAVREECNVTEKGVLHLSGYDFSILSSSNASERVKALYNGTLYWLSPFGVDTRPGMSLQSQSWGRHTFELGPRSIENITIAAGTFENTTKIALPADEHNGIWVNGKLPFPIKALLQEDFGGEQLTGEKPFSNPHSYELVKLGASDSFPSHQSVETGSDSYNLVMNDKTYKIDYSFSGDKGSIARIEAGDGVMALALVTPENSQLALTIPKDLLEQVFPNDATNDFDLAVFVDQVDVQIEKPVDQNDGSVTFVIPVEQGSEDLELLGTLLLNERQD